MKTASLSYKFICLSLILSCYFSMPCKGQDDQKEVVSYSKQADSYYKRQLYEEALKLYLDIVKDQPKDAKVNFRIGVCYLKTADKQKALEYLQKA